MKTQPKSLLWAVSATVMVWTLYAGTTLAQGSEKPLVGYSVITIDKFDVAQTNKTRGFSTRMLKEFRNETIDRLDGDRVFEEVIDAMAVAEAPPKSEASSQAETKASPGGKHLRLSGTVTKFSKGSRAKRVMIGFGSGASVLKVRFVLTDAETGAELLRTERKGKFSGWISAYGGSQQHGMEEASGDVLDGLIKDINKNR